MNIKKFFISVLLIISFFVPALAQSEEVAVPFTTLGGTISGNVVLLVEKSPYIVTEDVTLLENATMIVEPGVELRFNKNTGLNIRGLLLAEGAADKQIIFTSNVTTPSQNDWLGISIENTQGGKASLKFINIGYSDRAVYVECCHLGGPVTIADSVFHDNKIALGGYSGDWQVMVNTTIFENNTTAIIDADKIITDSIFRNNTCGICSTERTKVSNSSFTGNDVAIEGGSAEVTSSTISHNRIGVSNFESSNLSYNTITNNEFGIISNLYSENIYPINYNNIYNNSVANLENGSGSLIDAKYNYWGTIDVNQVAATISLGSGATALSVGSTGIESVLVLLDPFFIEPIDISKSLPLPQLKNFPISVVPFPDVSSLHPQATAIAYLKEHNIVHGHPDGLFRPNDRVNRAEALKMILASAGFKFEQDVLQPFKPITATPNIDPNGQKPALNNEEYNSSSSYTDVLSQHWFFTFVKKATDLGIVAGYPDGRFYPQNTVNMAEALKMILLSNSINVDQEVKSDPYNDVNKNDWYAVYFEFYKSYHLLEADNNNNIYPDTYLTRGQLSELIYRFIKKVGQSL